MLIRAISACIHSLWNSSVVLEEYHWIDSYSQLGLYPFLFNRAEANIQLVCIFTQLHKYSNT